jgi:hypothetical protein
MLQQWSIRRIQAMNDETKKDNYYQEQWAKIQVEKHDRENSIANFFASIITIILVFVLIYACH